MLEHSKPPNSFFYFWLQPSGDKKMLSALYLKHSEDNNKSDLSSYLIVMRFHLPYNDLDSFVRATVSILKAFTWLVVQKHPVGQWRVT